MAVATFLGTGNYLAPLGRYWNSFVLDGRILVEPSPAALPNLRRAGISTTDLEAVFISHFHADHTFGWPFLLLELVVSQRTSPFTVIGPPGVKGFLHEMLDVGGVQNVRDAGEARLELRYVEVNEEPQEVQGLRFQAVRVDHVDHLECFGYLIEVGDRIVGYSGDTRPCEGLRELARRADVLILECNSKHAQEGLPRAHMDVASVHELQAAFPSQRLVLTHMGDDVDAADLPGITVPNDFDTIDL